jgi:hypothetical protein
VVDSFEGSVIPDFGVVVPPLLVVSGLSRFPDLTGSRWRRVIRGGQCYRRVNGVDIGNVVQVRNRPRRVLVREGAEDHVASLGCGADRVELVGDQVRHPCTHLT